MSVRSVCRIALLFAIGAPACDPQVIDAVEIPVAGMGGAAGSFAGAGGTGTGGVAGTAGAAGTAGDVCPDPESDRDGDLVPDCDDECPNQPLKIAPEVCGCQFPDLDTEDQPGCVGLLDVLANRYAFDGTGAEVVDSWGVDDGALVGGVQQDGAVTLDGARSGDYVDLPGGLISRLESVTLEAWVTWSGGAGWQRIFDFGDDGTGIEDSRMAGAASSYLFLTTRIPADTAEQAVARVAYQRGVPVEARVDATRAVQIDGETHIAVTFDGPSRTMALYMNGALEGSRAFTETGDVNIELSAINDINGWLGRSLYEADADFGGLFYEFRIYSAALTAAQIRLSYSAGADAPFFP